MSRISGSIRLSPRPLFSAPAGRLDLSHTVQFDQHRSGWAYCMHAISGLHRENGVHFDDFIESRFSWDLEEHIRNGLIPYRRPWIGVLHNPPGIPQWLAREDSPEAILRLPQMQESLETCQGLFVLSNYLREWLAPRVPVPVAALVHPTETPSRRFTFEKYSANPRKKLIQIGYWLRRLSSLAQVPADGLTKVWLVTNDQAREFLEQELDAEGGSHGAFDPRSWEQWDWVDHGTYDRLLESNLVFVHLYDSSANNTIVECMVRNTPVLVNPLPAVIEYLGDRYPFYFESIDEAGSKATDLCLVRATHEYLRRLDKRHLTGAHFRRSIEHSQIYRSLAEPRPLQVVPAQSRTPVRDSPRPPQGPSFDLLMRALREELGDEAAGAGSHPAAKGSPWQPAMRRRGRPTIAIAAVPSTDGARGGAERLYHGLRGALEDNGVTAEQIEIAADGAEFDEIRHSYLTHYDADLSAFDGVISTKAPSFAIRHRNHVVYLPHVQRQFYDMFDAYPVTAEREAERDLIQRLDSAALRRTSLRGVFTVGAEMRDRLRTCNGVTAGVLHHPTTLPIRPCGGFRYLFLPGRLHRWKRIDLALEAVRRMRGTVELVISGEGKDATRLRHFADDLPGVRFVGHVSDRVLGELYADALAVLNLAVREDYGLTTIEGFLSGKPVITCSDSGETARLVKDGLNGFVCSPDPQAIAERLDLLAANPERARRMGQRGRESARDINWNHVCDTLLRGLDLAARVT